MDEYIQMFTVKASDIPNKVKPVILVPSLTIMYTSTTRPSNRLHVKHIKRLPFLQRSLWIQA